MPEEDYFIPFGRARLAREGDACTIVSFGRPVNFCLEAAEKLAEEGIEVDVLDMRTIRPLDIESVIESVKKTNRLVVVDQSWPFGSVASEVITQSSKRASTSSTTNPSESTQTTSPPPTPNPSNKRISPTRTRPSQR